MLNTRLFNLSFLYLKQLEWLYIFLMLVSSALLLLPMQADSQSPGHNENIQLKVSSNKLSGRYKGSLQSILDSLQQNFQLTYTTHSSNLEKRITGNIEKATLYETLLVLLKDVNYVLKLDETTSSIHIQFLCAQDDQCNMPGSPQKQPVEWVNTRQNKHPLYPDEGIDQMPLETQQLIEITNNINEVSPVLEEQFAMANRKTVIPVELQEQFSVANQETVFPPALQEQFAVANQKTIILPEWQEHFAVANQVTEIPPALQDQFERVNQTGENPTFRTHQEVKHHENF